MLQHQEERDDRADRAELRSSGRAESLAWTGLIVACAWTIVLGCASRFTISSVWDDAYITLRYADNAVSQGRLAWASGEAPTYGLTGPLYLAVVVPLRGLIGGNPALVALLSSLLCGFVSIVLLVLLARRIVSLSTSPRPVAVGLVLFVFAASIERVGTHFASGMDTTFAMAWMSAYLLLLERRAASSSLAADLIAGGFGGLAFLARADLLLFTVSIPFALTGFARDEPERWSALRLLGATLLVLALELLLTWTYFGSMLPLPFYAKGTSLYGEAMTSAYSGIAVGQLRAFLKSYWYLVLLASVMFLMRPFAPRRSPARVEAAVIAGTCAFVAYHALLVLPVMFYDQRFYYPALPALVFLGLRGFGRLAELWPHSSRRELRTLLLAIGLALTLLASDHYSASGPASLKAPVPMAQGDFSLRTFYNSSGAALVWPGLDVLADLPDDVVIATTEVGLPAAMNPRKRIVDLAGLNDTEIALGRTTPAKKLRAVLPDVIYLPHADYREMMEAIRGEPGLLSQYQLPDSPGAPPALTPAIRRGSRHFAALRHLLVASEGAARE